MPDRALLCGINDYASISDLRGCRNDVEELRGLFTEVLDFDPQNVRTLYDAEVTKSEIKKQWRWLLKDAAPGDRLVFHFSGHGSYIDDRDGDEADAVDELLCLYDMNFDDPDTYLLDDDIREFTKKIPRGVHFTFLFDSCHSGTATRMAPRPGSRAVPFEPAKRPMVAVEDSVARLEAAAVGEGRTRGGRSANPVPAGEAAARVTAPETAADRRDAVLARFIEPPPHVLEAIARGGSRRSLRAAADEEMNHVLLSGSRSDQTSADAFIGGDYHGAFTYHLCRAVRDAGADIDYQDLISAVRDALRVGRFSQVPQLEPGATRGPFLSRRTAETHGRDEEAESDGPSDSGARPSDGSDREFVALLRESVGLQRELLGLLKSRGPEPFDVARGGGRHLVYVHGICWHEAGFSDGWWESVAPHLPPGLRAEFAGNRHEVVWADLVSRPPGARAAEAATRSPEERELADDIRDVLEDRAERQALEALPEQSGDRPLERGLTVGPATSGTRGDIAGRALFGIPGLDCVDDFVKYLTDDRVRRKVLERFRAAVEPLLAAGGTVHVVSHSWGTVVAYEGLRALDGRGFGGQVASFSTVGSALSIPQVKRRLRPGDGGRPDAVETWANLDAKGDPVGGPLKDRPFAVDEEFLNLRPTGCRPTLGVYSPACAHSSYFHRDNDAVNRDIFARLLRG